MARISSAHFVFTLLSFAANAADRSQPAGTEAAPIHGYEIVGSWPHDPDAFTQGLLFSDGILYESTGLYGASSLRVVNLQTGAVRKKVELPGAYFGEGIALLDGKIYQLTWRSGKGFVYDQRTLERVGGFRYDGEGWGLTTDGRELIMSDGTHRLRFFDPRSFKLRRTLKVHDGDKPLTNLNELEYIEGEIYANIWGRNQIARIHPATGRVVAWIDLTGLHPAQSANAVLNGIAYDAERRRLFVTGKYWPMLFQIRVTERRN